MRIRPADVVGGLVGSVLLAGVITIGLGVTGRMLWVFGELLTHGGRFLVQRWDHWGLIVISYLIALYVFFFKMK